MSPDNFRPENGGVYLQPGVFGRILANWQTSWIETRQERRLDEFVQEVVAALRNTATRLPTCLEEALETGGSGSIANDEY
jgi:hypothetical protein